MAGRMMDQRRPRVQREDAVSHGVRCIVLGSIAGRRCAFDRESLSDALVRYCSRVLTRVAPRAMTQWQHDGSGTSALSARARARRRSFAHDRSRHASGPARRERPREARGVRPGGRGRAHAPTPSAATRRPLSAVLARLARSRGDAAPSCAAAGVLACGTGAPAVGGQ